MAARRSHAVHETQQPHPATYITDTDYVYSHFEELVPVNMKYAAALNGFKSPELNEGFTYVDLACGNGLTLCQIAAAYPQAQFFGFDSNPEHIAFAETLIKEGELKNLKLIKADITGIKPRHVPDADFMVAHGVLSWMDEEHRKAMYEVVDKKLKSGGLLYVNYNVLPGWSIKTPFLELIHYFTSEDESSEQRVKEGLKILQVLNNENAAYFVQNPQLRSELQRLNSKSMQYLIHEYLPDEWEAFYFREINDSFNDIGLQLAGSFPFRDNFKELIIPKNFHSLLDMQSERGKYEEYKDFVINSRVRKNIYARDDSPHVFDNHDAELYKGIYFASLKDADELNETVQIGSMTYDVRGPGYDILRKILPHQSYSMMELLNHPEMKGHSVVDVIDIITNFVVLNQATPCNGRLLPADDIDIRSVEVTHPLNRYLLDHVYPKGVPITLSCPATGTVMACNHVAAIALDSLLLEHGDEHQAIKHALEMAHDLHEDALFGDVEGARRAVSQVRDNLLVWLVRMGVVQ